MSGPKRFADLAEPTTTFDGVELDDVTTARLLEVCESAGAPPRAVIAAIVRDVLEDDADAHANFGAVHRPPADELH